jgi:hypothetical protein
MRVPKGERIAKSRILRGDEAAKVEKSDETFVCN